MKQKLLNSLRLRLCLLVATLLCVGGKAWGETVTIWSENWSSVTNTATEVKNVQNENATYSVNQTGAEFYNTQISAGGPSGAPELMIKKNGGAFTATINSLKGCTGNLTLCFYSNQNITLSGSNGVSFSQVGTVSNKKYTYSVIGATDGFSITFTMSKSSNARLDDIELVGENGSTPSLEPSNLAITGAPVALSFDLYNNSAAQTVNFTTSSTGAVTVSESEYVTTSVSGQTITVTPVKVTPSPQTITISQAADDSYAAGSATFTVTIDDSTPVTPADVTFDATQDKGNDKSITKNNVTMSVTDGVLNNGTDYRCYKSQEATISTSAGKIVKIVFTCTAEGQEKYGPGCFSLGNTQTGSYTYDGSVGTWTGNTESITLIASLNQVRATKVEVYLESDGTIAKPVFSGDADFLDNTEVTISAATGTTIYYTIDGTAPTTSSSVYSEPFTISATTTVKAIAVKDGNESEVSEMTFTKHEILTVAQALQTPDDKDVYVRGIVSRVTYFGSNRITYYISDDGTENNELEAYNGLNLNQANFSSKNDLQVGDEVVVFGTLTTYQSQKELAQDNYLISHTTKVEPEISYATTEYTVATGAAFETPVLTNPNNLTVTYSISENDGVATIDATTGAVTIGSNAGTVTVTASFAGDSHYRAGSASYTITVEAPATYATYVLATEIVSGKHYVIASGTEGSVKVMGDQGKNNRPAVDATITDGKLSVSDAYEFVIKSATIDETSGYSIFDAGENGYLYAASSSSNLLKTQEENNANGIWAITIGEDDVASIVAQGANTRKVMQFNPNESNNNPLFACYSSASQSPVYLFVKEEAEEPTTVTLNAKGYATYASTKALDFSDAEADGYTAWQVTAISGTDITFVQIKGAVAAGTGVLLKGEAGTTITMAFAQTGTDISATNKLVGITEARAVEANTYYGLKGEQFLKVKPGTVPAGKALLSATDVEATTGETKVLNFVFKSEADGVNEIANDELEMTNIFNLAGQRLQKLQKGVNIVGGKKVLVK